jgi:hypothetical protein
MRFKEFLIEASVFSRGTYSYGHKVKISDKKAGLPLFNAIKKEIPKFGLNMELEWKDPKSIKSQRGYEDYLVLIDLGRMENYQYFHIADLNVNIAIQGSDGVIEKSLVHAGEYKKFNRGDIAEGILGAALTAKLIKRGSDKIGEISEGDIKKVLSGAVSDKDSLVYSVHDKNSQISDKITFSLKLTGPSLDIISDTNEWNKFEDLFQASAHYSNSADSDRYSNYFYKNGKVDEVFVTSDGLSGQKSRKTDINVVVRDPTTGTVRSLKNVDISLKADSDQFGQSATGGFKGNANIWMEAANNLFKMFGITLSMPKTKNNIVGFYKEIYSQAATNIHNELEKASINKETTMVAKIADFIYHHATLNAPNVRIVNLEKGKSTIHSFHALKERLIKENIDLDASFKLGPRSGLPGIIIFDKNSKLKLLVIRYFSTKTQDKTAHVFEKGKLLSELTKVEKDRSNSKEKDQTSIEPKNDKSIPTVPAPNPVAKPKATTTAKSIVAPTKPVAPTTQQPDLSRSPLTAKWLNSR